MSRRTPPGQGALFDLPAGNLPAGGVELARPGRKSSGREPIVWPGCVRPWDVIDDDDMWLGLEYRWVTPARAREIRRGR